MSLVNRTVVSEHQSGTHVRFECNLADAVSPGFGGGNIVLDCLGYTIFAATVALTGTTDAGGIINFKQSNILTGPGIAADDQNGDPVTLTLVDDTTVEVMGLINMRYLVLDFKTGSAVFGDTGNVIIELIGKH